MGGDRIGNGLGDSLGLALKYFAQPIITEIVLSEGVGISEEDKAILRECAKKVAELAVLLKDSYYLKNNSLSGWKIQLYA